MKKNQTIKNFWEKFCAENPEINTNEPYEVWFFHHNRESSKKLVKLVLSGKKKATASLAEADETDFGDGGVVGGYSVVTDFDGNPQCVIQTTEVRVMHFDEVDEQFAFDEGEGDQTLEYWRTAHRKFFIECLEPDAEFDESVSVICKRFALLYPRK